MADEPDNLVLAAPSMRRASVFLRRIDAKVDALSDEVRVQGAMIRRLDSTLALLIEEFRATHVQITRMNDRIRKLEDAAP
jgi:outer membrane murein-binding lipoprotein Lpp